jgi:NAD(P)-dependent dehydrogenase (short-subunit alcohol dehydrogenase family)
MITAKGGQCIYVKTDVTQHESVKNAIRKTVETFGGLNVVYNNAGGSLPEDGSVTEVPMEIWERTLSRDLVGSFLCCRYGIPELIKCGGGSVIMTGSTAALTGWKRSAYTVAKGGVVSLTRVMAVDYAKYNIKVNCICPGRTVNERTLREEQTTPFFSDEQRPFHLLGFGGPNDIAYAALYLASDESRTLTGAIIPVDSGYTCVGRINSADILKK